MNPVPSRLHAQAVGWMAWATVNRFGQDGIRILSRIILARLLFPEDFGIFTLAITLVAGVQLCTELHVRTLLVQHREATPELISTAHWSQVALGAAGTVGLFLLASPVAGLAGHEAIAPVLKVLAFQVLLGACLTVPRAWLHRQLAFRVLAGRGLVSQATAAAVAVASAAAGLGVWALVIHELVTDVLELALLRVLVPWRPAWHWSRAEFREILRLAWPLMGHRGLGYLGQQGDRLIIGRAFGADVLGLYAVSLRLVQALTQSVDSVFSRVAFPAFAHTQDDPGASRRGFLEACRAQSLVTFPVTVALASLADHLVPLVLGSRWIGAAPFAQILAIRVLLGSLQAMPRASLLGRGRRLELLRLGGLGLAFSAVGWSVGFAWGPLGVAAGGMAGTAGLAVLSSWAATRELALHPRDWLRALGPAIAGTAAMALGIQLALALLRDVLPAHGILLVMSSLLVGGVAFGLALGPWLPGEIRRYRAVLRPTPGQSPEGPVSS